MASDPYVYPGTDCLRNRLGIRDRATLERVEANRTAVTLALLQRRPIQGRYDLAHMKRFHRRVLGDIYQWAGELRTVAIAKEDRSLRCPSTSKALPHNRARRLRRSAGS